MGINTIHRRVTVSVSLVLLVGLFVAATSDNERYRYRKNNSFFSGEKLDYRVHFGFISAGEATLSIDDELESVNGRPCYKIDVSGQTSGFFDFFYTVRDSWGTYLDTASLVPHKFYEDKRENKYRKHEVVEFNHCTDTAKVYRLDKEKPTEYFSTPKQPQDLVSGYYYIRTLDYTDIKKGDVISLDAFYDKEVYDFKVRFLGREVVKTKLGKVKTLAFTPIMKKNDLFEDGDEKIKIWLSDDSNKIPIKISAKMWLGAVELDLTSVENLRGPLAIVDK